jgi:hypothetical protein
LSQFVFDSSFKIETQHKDPEPCSLCRYFRGAKMADSAAKDAAFTVPASLASRSKLAVALSTRPGHAQGECFDGFNIIVARGSLRQRVSRACILRR